MGIDNWVELLSVIQLALSSEHRKLIQKVINIYSLSKKVLDKIELLKKYEKKGSQFKERDKVYLRIKNLKNKRLLKKLNYIKVGLFLINK